jgi:hypothetical protein
MNGFVVPAIAQQELATRLGEAHRFNSHDVERNQEGSITPSQWWRLLAEACQPLLRALAGSALLLACLAGVYSLVSKQSSVSAIIYIALGAACLGLTGTLVRLFKHLVDCWQGQVWQVTGRLNPSWEDRGRGLVNSSETGSRSRAAYRYTVAGEVFEVNDRVYRLLADYFELGYPVVTLYYTPYTRRVLSLQISGMDQTQAAASHPLQPKTRTTPGLWRS